MAHKLARIAVYASLLLTLAAGPTIALCGQVGETACCCSEAGCPMPKPTTVEPRGCCSADAPSPATTAVAQRATPSGAKTTDAAPAGDSPVLCDGAEPLSVRDRQGGDPRSVALFTLHAVLLI